MTKKGLQNVSALNINLFLIGHSKNWSEIFSRSPKLNQSINQYSFIWWHDITTDINAIAIYIAGLDSSKAKYPECPADNDIYRAFNIGLIQNPSSDCKD